MSLLLRGRDCIGKPVVTITGGEALGEVKDVVYGTADAAVAGFTLRKRGFLGGPLKRVLPWAGVAALGRDAVMVRDRGALVDRHEAFGRAVEAARGRDVLGSEVLTEGGDRLGEVSDVVLLVDRTAQVVGYEIAGHPGRPGRRGRPVFLPLPDTLAVSGEALMVPATARDYVCEDLAGFGAAVERFRDELRRGR